MHIIARKTLCDYWSKVPETEQALKSWFAEVVKARWSNTADIKAEYRSASILKNNEVVFNICGNRHRLIVRVNYSSATVFIRFLGTHAEYNEIVAEEV